MKKGLFLILAVVLTFYSCIGSGQGFLKYNDAERDVKNRNFSAAVEN